MDYTAISAEDLVVACAEPQNDAAWIEFVRRFQPLIASVVLRISGQWGKVSPQEVDDLIQETYLKLCEDRARLLRNFKAVHQDAIYGYIKVFAANLAHDHFKVTHSQKRGGGKIPVSIEGVDSCQMSATRSTEKVLERELLIKQIDACLRTVVAGPSSERDRKIFWLYYRVGLAASAIAALPTIDLTTKGVETTLLRLTRHVRDRLLFAKKHPGEKQRSEGVPSADSL